MGDIKLIIDQVVNFMVSIGPLGGAFLIMLESFIPPLPLGVFVGLNMLSFGHVFGFLLSYFSTIAGCMLSFLLFRYLLRDKYMNWISKKDQQLLQKWTKKLSHIKLTTLAVIFALPITPAFLVNIAGGISNISTKKYLLALFIGKPAMLLFYGYIAVSLVDSLNDPLNIVKIILLVIFTYALSKVIGKVVKVDD